MIFILPKIYVVRKILRECQIHPIVPPRLEKTRIKGRMLEIIEAITIVFVKNDSI